ncbi:MAG: hypothetical protein AAGD96_34775, partial [Chloroflexota bacterium]
MQLQPIPRWELLTALAIIVLAGVLRTMWPGITEFKADEARMLTLAYEMAEFKTFPTRGISSSVGLPNFPVSVWVYAIPLFFWKHVYAATLFTGLLNTAAVALCYFFTRRYIGRTAAIVATLMFAVSPWAIIHARKIWAQNLLAFFVMAWAFSAALTFVEGRKKWLIVHIAVGVIAFQIHLAAISLLVASAVLFIIFWRQIPWRTFLIGCGVALLTLAPFAYYIFAQSSGLAGLIGGTSGRSFTFSWEPFVHVARLTTGWQFHAITGPEQFENFLVTLPPLNWIYWIWAVLCLIGFGFTIYDFGLTIQGRANTHNTGRDSRSNNLHKQDGSSDCRSPYRSLTTAYLLLTWSLVPILTFLWFPVQPELHYLLPVYPVFYIFAGMAFERVSNRNVQNAALAGLGVTVALFVWSNVALLNFVDKVETPGGFGEPVKNQLANVNQAKLWLAETNAAEVLIVSDGVQPLIDSDAAIYDLHLRDVPHRFIDGTHTAVFPAENSVVFITDDSFSTVELLAKSADRLATGTSRSRNGGVILTLNGGTRPEPLTRFDPIFLLSNFVNVQGIDWPDGSGRFAVHWKTGEAFQPDYHVTGQLFTADGERVGQADIPVFPPDQWRPDDIVVSLFEPEPT